MRALLQDLATMGVCLGLLWVAWIVCRMERPSETRHLERAASYRPRRDQ